MRSLLFMKRCWCIDMKKNNYIFLLSIVILGVFSSCYKDLSTKATKTIPDIVFGNEQDTISIAYGEILRIEPQVSQEGRNPEDLSYLWEIDMTPNNANNRLIISEEPILELQIAQTPSEIPYILSLTVTDNITGYGSYKAWSIFIGTSLGEGLVVAHTKDRGKTSDIDFVSSERVTFDYEEEDITYIRNLYSLANDSKYQGNIKSMCYNMTSQGATYNTSRLLVGSETEMFSMSLLTMERELDSEDLIVMGSSDEEYDVDEIFNYGGATSGAIVNNRLYNMSCRIGATYGEAGFNLEPKNVITETNSAYSKRDLGDFAFFDSVHDGFYYMIGWSAGTSGSMLHANVSTSYSIANSECLGAGSLQNNILSFVVKTNNSGYVVSSFNLETDPIGYSEYKLDGTDIENAVSFAFCDNANVFYYATPESVYANIITGDRITTRRVSWTPDNTGEKITKIIHYQQAWYGTQNLDDNTEYDFVLPTHQLQMLIVTYNESTGEGKIYLKPFNVNTGLFSMTDEGEVFEGFGEITAIASTPR